MSESIEQLEEYIGELESELENTKEERDKYYNALESISDEVRVAIN